MYGNAGKPNFGVSVKQAQTCSHHRLTHTQTDMDTQRFQ